MLKYTIYIQNLQEKIFTAHHCKHGPNLRFKKYSNPTRSRGQVRSDLSWHPLKAEKHIGFIPQHFSNLKHFKKLFKKTMVGISKNMATQLLRRPKKMENNGNNSLRPENILHAVWENEGRLSQ